MAATPIIASRLPASAVSLLAHVAPFVGPGVVSQCRAPQEEADQPRPILRLRRNVGEQRLADRREQAPAAIGAVREAGGFEPRRRATLLRSRLAIIEDRATVGVGHAVRQKRHQPDQAMRRARRIEGGERKVERGAQARFAVVAGAMAQQISPPVAPVGGQAFEVGFALRIGGKQLDRQRMAVERAEEAGQGGVGGEMIAGVAQEQGARIGVLKLFDVSQRSRAGARKFWRLAANGDDEPEAVDGGEPAQKRLSRGCILVARASPDCRESPASADAAQAAAILASTSEAAPDAGRPRSVASRVKAPSAFGAGSRLTKNRRALPKRAMTRGSWAAASASVVLPMPSRARHDNGPVLFEDRLDELLQPILAADHFWVGRQRGQPGTLSLRRHERRRLGEAAGRRREYHCRCDARVPISVHEGRFQRSRFGDGLFCR